MSCMSCCHTEKYDSAQQPTSVYKTGCFPILNIKKKKKKPKQFGNVKRVNPEEQVPSVLPSPEPQIHTSLLQLSTLNLRTRMKPFQPINKVITKNINKELSAPSTLNVAEQDPSRSVEYKEQEEAEHQVGSTKEQYSSILQPLTLPSPESSDPSYAYDALPLPPITTFQKFPYEEINVAAWLNFSSNECLPNDFSSIMFKTSFHEDASSSKKFKATRSHPSSQGLKELISEVNTTASLEHPNLCRLLDFYAHEGSEQRMLVSKTLYHGSFDRLLYGRFNGPPIHWNIRMKIALCTAQKEPFQAMYNEFSTVNMQIDNDFSAKLSKYGCVGHIPEAEISWNSVTVGKLSTEKLQKGMFTSRSNVLSCGIFLMEFLAGRKNLDRSHPIEKRNLVWWTPPFQVDDRRLSLAVDPHLKGHFPSKAARTIVDIAQRCLQKEPSKPPTIRTSVEHLKIIQDMKYSIWFPQQDPANISGKQMSKSPSLNGFINLPPRLSFAPSSPSAPRLSASPLG